MENRKQEVAAKLIKNRMMINKWIKKVWRMTKGRIKITATNYDDYI